jgi:hypothetical protein
MFHYKTHKQEFIMTALVILLFLGCFVGVTLTLFKSDLLDGNDGTIGIITTSGSVEIDIVDLSGKTLQNKALALMTSSGATDSEKVLFEPGATFYTQGFKIKNTGDIPVNFSLSVSKDDKIDMEECDKAFELWIVKEGDDFRNAKKLTEFKVNGLAAGESSDTYYLFIKMQETAGNEFQGKTYTGIGVTVYAVQSNARFD